MPIFPFLLLGQIGGGSCRASEVKIAFIIAQKEIM